MLQVWILLDEVGATGVILLDEVGATGVILLDEVVLQV